MDDVVGLQEPSPFQTCDRHAGQENWARHLRGIRDYGSTGSGTAPADWIGDLSRKSISKSEAMVTRMPSRAATVGTP
ncbi:MAG: hypothetical protein LC620_03220, partial [Halobacteriales archaeon]|nr:hypothetical protein [Halobacteriales archaeon]